MATEIRQVWVSKYALTKGLYEAEVRLCESGGSAITTDHRTYLAKGDWWDTKEKALGKAEVMRKAKIASLTKQIKALEDKVFGH